MVVLLEDGRSPGSLRKVDDSSHPFNAHALVFGVMSWPYAGHRYARFAGCLGIPVPDDGRSTVAGAGLRVYGTNCRGSAKLYSVEAAMAA